MSASSPIRIAIVEQDEEPRQGLRQLLDKSPGTCCAGVFASAEPLLEQLREVRADVVLINVRLPGISGIEAVRKIKRLTPATQVMMLTLLEDDDTVFASLSAGATGYLLKSTPPAEILEAICELHKGGSPMSASIARRVVEEFQKPHDHELAKLSPRETEILAELAKGRLYKEIAGDLGITVETVRTHVRNIYEKLHVRTRTEAVVKFLGSTGP